jgi:Prasinovirus endonuclease VII
MSKKNSYNPKQKHEYYIRHKSKILKRFKKYQQKNKRKLALKAKAHYIKNRKKALAYRRRYYKKNAAKIKAKERIRQRKNKRKISKQRRRFRDKNKERVAKQRRKHYKKYKKQIIKKQVMRDRKRLKTDIQFKISKDLRRRLNLAIKGNFKAGSAVLDLGCTIVFLKKYIEKKFYGNMTWENWGTVWELDHKKALWKFDLTNRKQFLKAVNYKNLQPLTISDHRKKTAKETKERWAKKLVSM